jgi:pimeloyl-ACP methyl ester carboxylesterase
MSQGWPAGVEPSKVVSRDGTSIAVFSTGTDGPPLLLVHGTTADHTTFRVVGPRFGETRAVHAMDRRGRGASSGRGVDVIGHSYGGRCALGAAIRTAAIGRVVSYEGAPTPQGVTYHPPGLEARLSERLAAADRDGALATFLAEVVGMTLEDLAAYRANPVWPARAAAADTILRELAAEASQAASVDALGGARQPVLQLLGSASLPVFRDATVALDDRLRDSRIVVIDGAQHAAHHTHPDAFVSAVEAFLS